MATNHSNITNQSLKSNFTVEPKSICSKYNLFRRTINGIRTSIREFKEKRSLAQATKRAEEEKESNFIQLFFQIFHTLYSRFLLLNFCED